MKEIQCVNCGEWQLESMGTDECKYCGESVYEEVENELD